MKKLMFVFAAAALSSLVGCGSVPMSSPEQDAAAKKFTTSTDKASLYVYRNESMGGAVTMHVLLDNVALGDTSGHTYLYKLIAPGKHTITSQAENTDMIEIDAKAGSNVFVWQEAKMGVLYARCKLHLVEEAAGKQGVLESKMAITK